MSFSKDNKYWLKQFFEDFIKSQSKRYALDGTSAFTTDEFNRKYILKNNIKELKFGCFLNLISMYHDISMNYIISTHFDKLDIYLAWNTFLCNCDKDNTLGLKQIKFDLVDLSKYLKSYDYKKHYLVVCDIDKSINFELVYGTLKVLNKI